MGQNQSLSGRSKSSNSSWLEKLPRIKCIVQPNSLKPTKSCPCQPVIGYYDMNKVTGIEDPWMIWCVYSEAHLFHSDHGKELFVPSVFCNFATKESALMTRGALIATLSGLQLRLHFEMLSMLHPSASSLFSERENPFCRRPLAGCCLKPLRPRLTDILQKYSETASAPHWDLVEWTMSPCHTLTGDFESLALFAPSWNGRCDEELARV